MKKILSMFLALVLALSLFACAAPQAAPAEEAPAAEVAATEAPAAPEEPAKSDLVGICLPAADHGWVAAVTYHAENMAKELGLNYKLVTSKDPNEQANQIDELINLGCAVIVLFPHNNELDVAAQKILDAGIKLVNFDRKVNVDSTCYLAGDNRGMGVNGAKFIGEKLGGVGKVVIVGVPAYGSINVERIDGFKETMAAEYPNIEILQEYGAPSSSKEDGLKLMPDILTANPQIDAVYSMDDELSIGLYQAIKEANRTDVKAITGGGGAQSYFNLIAEEQNIALSSQLYNPLMIKECVQIAKDLLDGKMVEMVIIKNADTVDKSNVAEYLDANSPY